MKRVTHEARLDWRKKVESRGMVFHHTYGEPYWTETASYVFTMAEIEVLETAAKDCWELSLAAAEVVVQGRKYGDLAIPDRAVKMIESTWEAEPPALYGRMDFMFDEHGVPKLLEFNADTPTMLLEAAVIQWDWLQELHPDKDQFSGIHEKLVAKWRDLIPHIKSPVHFAHAEAVEDLMTISYLQDTAREAGLETKALHMKDIGWDANYREFIDLDSLPMRTIFKLYPWEWMWREAFSQNLYNNNAQWIEPAWKLLLSSKGILPYMWKQHYGHPNLLPTYFDYALVSQKGVRKPKLGREGNNVIVFEGGKEIMKTDGPYTDSGYIYQAFCESPQFDGICSTLGVWLVDGEPCGLGVREVRGLVVRNESPFVPHYIDA